MKHNRIFRLAAVFMCAAILCSLIGCAADPAVLTYGSSAITEGEFRYYLATYKGKFAQTYTDFKDNASFYASPLGDSTVEDYLFDSVVHNVSMTLVCSSLFDEYGLQLDPAVSSAIDAYLDDFVKEYADGSRNVFNQALSQFGVNLKMLRNLYLRDERTSALFQHLYGENGTVGVTDNDRTAYLEENYVRVRHIYVNNKYVYAADEDGYPVYSAEGVQQTVPMTGDELAAKNELIAAIDEALADGGDFEEIYAAMSEDQYYQNGYYLTRTTDFVDGVVSSAFDLAIGEWIKVESDYGTHYIKRMELQEKPWEDENNADFFENYGSAVAEALFAEWIESKLDGVEANAEILSGYSVEKSPTNTRF